MRTHYCDDMRSRRANRGFSLIELMIALVLGLLVVGAAISMFLTNSQTFRATENLSRIQENLRVSFELMARDLREAGGNPCNSTVAPVNILKTPHAFWSDWPDGIRGFDDSSSASFINPALGYGSGTGDRVAGTDAVEVKSARATGAHVTTQMTSPSADLDVDSTAGIAANDVVMVCDFDLVSIFEATAVGTGTISHGAAGNCADGFYKTLCASPPGSTGAWHRYRPDAMVAVPEAQRWYIGNNARGGSSLYRSMVRGKGSSVTTDSQEVVEGVSNMQITYLAAGAVDYVPASGISAWGDVTAVRIELDMTGNDRVGVDGAPISRTLSHVVTLRNHML